MPYLSRFLPLKKCVCLLRESGTQEDPGKRHLHIILTNPNSNEEVLLVSVSSFPTESGLRRKTDDSCILFPNDYPSFIRHKSYIAYKHTKIKKTEALQIEIDNNKSAIHGMVSEEVLSRICQGPKKSKFTSPKILKFYEEASKA